MLEFTVTLVTISAFLCIFWLVFRVRLNPNPEFRQPPDLEDLSALSNWLELEESRVLDLVDGAGAHIQFANPSAPGKTGLCFLYVHGFSATWPETAPVTEKLAARYGANVLQARLAGHGMGPKGMTAPAEDWLVSLWLSWQIATRLGDKVVIVATSTGAPVSVWLASQPDVTDRLKALLFMSPNFRIRSAFDFLLTAPLSRHWIRFILGKEREWEPENETQAKYWTWKYSTRALIEMQKTVDWAKRQDLGAFKTPMAVMYMKNDPTISPEAAIKAFNAWGGSPKQLLPVAIDPDTPDHVFVGDITAPHRVDWTVEKFADFLDEIDT